MQRRTFIAGAAALSLAPGAVRRAAAQDTPVQPLGGLRAGARARGGAVRPARAGRARGLRQPLRRSLYRDPLSRGPAALHRSAVGLCGRARPLRLHLPGAGDDLPRRRRDGEEARLRPVPVHLRRHGAARGRHPARVRGVPHPQPDQPAGGADARSRSGPARPTSRRSRRTSSSGSAHAGSPSAPARRRARSFPSSAPTGSRPRPRGGWSCIRCSTARAPPAPTASPSGRAIRPRSTSRRRSSPAPRSQHLGLAPMTSMFLFDAKDRAAHDDFRLGVHNSDGLAMWNGVGRAALAAAAFAAAPADQRLRQLGAARLRADPARADLLRLRGPRRRSTTGARASGPSRSATGARGTSSWSRSRPTTRSTTISSPTGGRSRRSRRGARSR